MNLHYTSKCGQGPIRDQTLVFSFEEKTLKRIRKETYYSGQNSLEHAAATFHKGDICQHDAPRDRFLTALSNISIKHTDSSRAPNPDLRVKTGLESTGFFREC